MTSTQVVRDILQVAKGMLPPSQQSTQNIRSIEEMARNLVAQKSHSLPREKTEEEKEKERETEELKKKVEERIKHEKEIMTKSNELSSQKMIFFEKYEEMSHSLQLNKKPQIVVVGMQGSGKSELIEGLIGIPFQYIHTSVATTVPILIETIYKKGVEAKCSFCYGNGWEELPFDEVSKRIERICNDNKSIGEQEILIKIESQNVIPLIFVDLPGFREVYDETQSKIEKLWEKYVKEEEGKLVFCVEKSTEERGENSSQMWLMEKKKVRKNVVIVGSKFDSRIVETKEKDEMEEYLDGEIEKCDHFYVSFLNKRGFSTEGYVDALTERHLEDIRRLVTMGVDEKYFDKIGVWRLNMFLKERMMEEYKRGLNEINNDLKKVIEETDKKVNQLQEENRNVMEDGDIKRNLHSSVSNLGNLIIQLITGECTISPKEYGETMEEERKSVQCDKWPGVGSDISIIGNGMKLYGGAQYERLLKETEAALLTMELPVPTADEVCVAMGIHAIGGMLNGGERVVSVVIKTKAAQALNSVIVILMKRITHVFERLFEVAVDVMEKVFSEKSVLQVDGLNSVLRDVYVKFLREKLKKCEKMVKEDLNSFVAVVDWNMLCSGSIPMAEEEINTEEGSQQEDHNKKIKERVQKLMEEREKNEMKVLQELRNINGGDSHSAICKICQRVFGVIREGLWRNTRSKLNAYFLQPMIGELKEELSKQLINLENVLTSNKTSKEDRIKQIALLDEEKKEFCRRFENSVEVKNLLMPLITKTMSQTGSFESPTKKRLLFN